MSSGDRQDPTLMLLIFCGVLSVAAWRTVAGLDPGQVLAAVGSVAPLALGALAIATSRRLRSVRLVERSRCIASAEAIVPADDFDPKTDAVLRFAAELAATERRLRG